MGKENEIFNLVLRELPREMDKSKLIAEIRKRPLLWSKEYVKPRNELQQLWSEVAEAVGADAMACKIQWRHLRSSYGTEIRRFRIRKEKDRRNGIYLPKKHYRSRWLYFKDMKYLEEEGARRSKKYNLKTNEADDAPAKGTIETGPQEERRLKTPTNFTDYHFLVSFLPQMEKLSDLQNLQFRAQLCDMALRILAPKIDGDGGNNTAAVQLIEE